jgi:hypothetical protein
MEKVRERARKERAIEDRGRDMLRGLERSTSYNDFPLVQCTVVMVMVTTVFSVQCLVSPLSVLRSGPLLSTIILCGESDKL